jgi:hypothetical protein
MMGAVPLLYNMIVGKGRILGRIGMRLYRPMYRIDGVLIVADECSIALPLNRDEQRNPEQQQS